MFRNQAAWTTFNQVSSSNNGLSTAAAALFSTAKRFSSVSSSFSSSSSCVSARVFPTVNRRCERAILYGSAPQRLSTTSNASSSSSSSLFHQQQPAVSAAGVMATARRFQSQQATSEQQKAEGEKQQQQQKQEQKGDEKATEGGDEKTKGEEEPKKSGFRAQYEGIKRDITEFPDIYNGPNMLSVAFFTIFCLSSTGTQVEADWWLKHWAIDGDSHLRPWSLFLHSIHMNNFLSVVFAILLLHNSLHPLTHALAGGSQALMQYCALVSVLSGVCIWAFLQAWYDPNVKDVTGRPLKGEKQYGPWDIASAVMVMQYLRLGIPPHRLLLSFNGWVKYACCVGAVCILYYDPQPVVFGTLFGFLLCRFAPVFRGVATV